MTILEKIEKIYAPYQQLTFEDLTFEVIHRLAEGTWLVYNQTDMSDRAFMDAASDHFVNFCKAKNSAYVKTLEVGCLLFMAATDPILLEMCHTWYRRKIFELSDYKFKHGEPY